METQHKGKVVASHKSSSGAWYTGNRISPGVSFRTDYMKYGQIVAESGECRTVKLSRPEIDAAFERAKQKYKK